MEPRRSLTRARLRVTLLALLSSLWICALAGRLVYLQILARPALLERAELQQQHTMKIDPRRGTIYDRNGRALAVSVQVESVYAVPRAIEDPQAVARALARCLPVDGPELARRLSDDKSFLWVHRKANPAASDCVRQTEIPGIHFLPESRRFYPKRNVAAHVLGYVGMDDEGMSGVEYAFESEIRGEPGRQIIWTDARKRPASSRIDEHPQPGRSVYLTLDETLQYFAEVELEQVVAESEAKSAVAILMRSRTGEILAMAGVPDFNPNRYGAYPPSSWRNRSVTDAYEPGSTFKIVTAAAALEEGVVSEDERIDCGRGSILVGERLIHDYQPFDVLTFREVLEKSSNVGMIRIGQRLGRERMARYIRAFGFGEPTGVGVSAESRGILRDVSRWGPASLAAISFGQEIAVTPLQMISAVNSLATSGYLMRPILVKELRSPTNDLLQRTTPQPIRRVISEDTAIRLTTILTGVVERGTGSPAAIPGFSVAGKTGTAQKAVSHGGYSKTDFVASFVGFVPASRPELTGLVILDSPSGDHSGKRAAGVFARILERSLRYLGIVPDARETTPTRLAAKWPEQSSVDPRLVSAATPGWTVSRASFTPPLADARVPSLRGLPGRDAAALLFASELIPEIVGSGWVVGQLPPAGTVLEPGSHCVVVLGPKRLAETEVGGPGALITDARVSQPAIGEAPN